MKGQLKMKEKIFIRRNRLICLFLFLLNVFFPVITSSFDKNLELLDSNLYCEYDEYGGYSNCELELIFNKSVSSGSATVYFYDKNDNLIDTEIADFYLDGDVVYDNFYFIPGEVYSYDLSDMDFVSNSTEMCVLLSFICFPFTLAFFISSLTLKYKEYNYQGKLISVYAGYFNHYLKINEELFDEYKTSIFNFYPVVLSCTIDSGEKIQATISTSNHITLKINDKLIRNN